MRVKAIFLNYGERTEHTNKVLANINQAGYHFDLEIVNIKGIAKAINSALTPGYDGYAILANDILMPNNWLKTMVHYAQKLPNTGIVGIHTVETLPKINDDGVHPTWCPFGNWLITKECFEKVGYFNTDHDPYGMQDSDYGYRASKAGFYNYYIPGKAEHIGHDCGELTPYRKMKDEGLSKAGEIYMRWIEYYDRTGNLYLPLEQKPFNIE